MIRPWDLLTFVFVCAGVGWMTFVAQAVAQGIGR